MAERLQRYRERRDFSITPEPRGAARSSAPKGLRYYIQRHAVQTEDHPLEYGEFEGVIPEKQYGAGAAPRTSRSGCSSSATTRTRRPAWTSHANGPRA
jgi:hypothetical protein